MTDIAPPPADPLTSSLAELRLACAAEGTRKGLAGALQAAILAFLETLLALLAEFRAGRLAAEVPSDGATVPGRGAGMHAPHPSPADQGHGQAALKERLTASDCALSATPPRGFRAGRS